MPTKKTSLSSTPGTAYLSPYRAAISVGVWTLVSVGLISYFQWPIHGDSASHLTGIHQAALADRGLDEVWTFRGPTYNTYLFFLYKGASIFAPFPDGASFDTALKTLHLGVVAAASTIGAIGIARRFRSFEGWTGELCGLFLMGYLSSAWVFWLHAEDVTVLLLLFSAGLATRHSAWALLGAGAIASLMPLLKGVTAVMVVPALALVWVNRTRPWRATGLWATGFALSGGLQGYLFTRAWPLPVQDLLEAAVFQGSALPSFSDRLGKFRLQWPGALLYGTPITAPAICLLPAVLVQLLSRRRWGEVALLTAAWLVPLAMLIAQHKYFAYHAGCIVFAAALTVASFLVTPTASWSRATTLVSACAFILLFNETDSTFFFEQPIYRFVLLGGSCSVFLATWMGRQYAPRVVPFYGGIAVVLAMVFVVPWFTNDKGLSVEEGHSLRQRDVKLRSKVRFQEQKYGVSGEKVLTLTYGSRARLFDVKSACRHYFPIPLQRFRTENKKKFEESSGFLENRDCIFGYTGEFVLLEQRWMQRSDLYSDLKSHLDSRYQRIAWMTPKKGVGLWRRMEPNKPTLGAEQRKRD